MLIEPRRAEHPAAAGRGTPSRPARVMTKLGTPNAGVEQAVEQPDERARRAMREQRSRRPERQPELHERHGEDRRREPADRADREVDLAEQQHEHDAERDRADRRALHREVHEVGARQEDRVEHLEDAQITTSPTTTGSEPRSPPRIRATTRANQSPHAARCGKAGRCWSMMAAHAQVDASITARAAAAARRATRVVGGAGDRGDDRLAGDVGDAEVAVVAAEPQHDDAVGDGLHVGHVVADQDDAVPALAQPLDEVEHLGGLRDAERGGRLVEDDDARLADERPGDRDGLALAAGERGDRDAHRGDLAR